MYQVYASYTLYKNRIKLKKKYGKLNKMKNMGKGSSKHEPIHHQLIQKKVLKSTEKKMCLLNQKSSSNLV